MLHLMMTRIFPIDQNNIRTNIVRMHPIIRILLVSGVILKILLLLLLPFVVVIRKDHRVAVEKGMALDLTRVPTVLPAETVIIGVVPVEKVVLGLEIQKRRYPLLVVLQLSVGTVGGRVIRFVCVPRPLIFIGKLPMIKLKRRVLEKEKVEVLIKALLVPGLMPPHIWFKETG